MDGTPLEPLLHSNSIQTMNAIILPEGMIDCKFIKCKGHPHMNTSRPLKERASICEDFEENQSDIHLVEKRINKKA